MMKLSLMAKVFVTVDEETLHSPISDRIGERWHESEGRVTQGRGSENFAFRVGEHGNESHFLRFNHETERTVDLIQGELDFIEHLAKKGLPVARPVTSKSGKLVETVDTPLGTFHASLIDALPGTEPDAEELGNDPLSTWGELVGRVHSASVGYDSATRPTWRDLIHWIRTVVPESEAVVRTEVDSLERLLAEIPQETSGFGLIHLDIDNCRWDGDRVSGIFDFDDCAYLWFEADIASALTRLFDKRIDRFNPEDDRLKAFLSGYRSVRGIGEVELSRFPLFMRLGSLIAFARTVWSVGDGPESLEPEWTTDLRQDCHEWLDGWRVDFEARPIEDYVT